MRGFKNIDLAMPELFKYAVTSVGSYTLVIQHYKFTQGILEARIHKLIKKSVTEVVLSS